MRVLCDGLLSTWAGVLTTYGGLLYTGALREDVVTSVGVHGGVRPDVYLYVCA